MLLACAISQMQRLLVCLAVLIQNSSLSSCHVSVVCMCMCGYGKHASIPACVCMFLGDPRLRSTIFFDCSSTFWDSPHNWSQSWLIWLVSTATSHWDPSPSSGSKSWTSRWGLTSTHVGCGALNASHCLLGQGFDLHDTALAPKLL